MHPQSTIAPPDSASIYLLRDPETGDPAYVGQTVKPLGRRLSDHLQRIGDGPFFSPKERWLKDLKNRGLKPTIELLESVELAAADDREHYHINHLRAQGYTLTNSNAAQPVRRRTVQPRWIGRMRALSTNVNGDAARVLREVEPNTVTIAEASKLLKLHKNTVRHRIKIGVYKAHKVLTPQGDTYLIDRADFERVHPGLLSGETVEASNAIEDSTALQPVVEIPPAILEQYGGVVRDAVAQALQPYVEEMGRLQQQLGVERGKREAVEKEIERLRNLPLLRRLMPL